MSSGRGERNALLLPPSTVSSYLLNSRVISSDLSEESVVKAGNGPVMGPERCGCQKKVRRPAKEIKSHEARLAAASSLKPSRKRQR